MSKTCFGFLWICVLTRIRSQDADHHCSRYVSKKDGFEFTEPGGPATLAIGCIDQWLDLICCASRFKKITWYQTTDGGATWQEFKTNNKTRNLSKTHQVAMISSLNPSTDSGSYKCVVEGFQSGQRLENTVYTEIRNCSSWSGPPVWLNPRQEVTTFTVTLGDNVSIPCKTLSGTNCFEDFQCKSFWFKPPNGPIVKDNDSARVRFDYACSSRTYVMESILSISEVRDEDFRDYNCSAENDNGWALDRIVILKREEPADRIVPVTAAIVGAVILSMAVLGALIAYQTRIDLDLRIRWFKRRRRDVELSVMLINDSQDDEFARHLKNILEERFGFTVTSEVHFGEAPIARVPELAERCNSALVLLTPALLSNGTMLAIVRDVIAQAQALPVFVDNGSDLGNQAGGIELDENILGALSVSPALCWPGLGGSQAAMPEADQPYHWARRTTARQTEVFQKELCLSLLKKILQRNNATAKRVRQDSSGPLLP